MRRAKIVCTLGPATASPEIIRNLVAAGMNVARLNLSHGEQADHARSYEMVRTASNASGKGVGILADLQGPKIRLGRFASGPVELHLGDSFTITTRDVAGDATICGTTYSGLPGDCKIGDRILIDDGKVGLEVLEVTSDSVQTRVTEAGTYSVTYQNSFGACSAITNDIVIEYSSQIAVTNPYNLYRCNTGSGSYTYNLDSNTALLKTGLDANTIVTYHASMNDANAINNPLPLQYTSAPNTTIYARVEVPGGCFVIKTFVLYAIAPAIANQPQNLSQCENSYGSNVANFNLSTLRATILGSQLPVLYDVFFYSSQANADSNNNPLNSINYTSGNTTIYVRVHNKSDVAHHSFVFRRGETIGRVDQPDTL